MSRVVKVGRSVNIIDVPIEDDSKQTGKGTHSTGRIS